MIMTSKYEIAVLLFIGNDGFGSKKFQFNDTPKAHHSRHVESELLSNESG